MFHEPEMAAAYTKRTFLPLTSTRASHKQGWEGERPLNIDTFWWNFGTKRNDK